MSERQESAPRSGQANALGERAWRVLLFLFEIAILFGLFFLARFGLSALRPAESRSGSLEWAFIPSVPAPHPPPRSQRLAASFDGHSYICAEDPQSPGNYAVVFTPPLAGDEAHANQAIRHAIQTAYGQDVSDVVPNITRQGDARRVEFNADGVIFVAVTAWKAPAGELAAFTLHREE